MGLFTLCLFSLIIAIIVYAIIKRWKYLKLKSELGYTGPSPNFFFGVISDIFVEVVKYGAETSPYYILKLHKKFGDTFGIYVGSYFTVVTCDPILIKEVFVKQFGNFTDRETNSFLNGYPLHESLLQVPKVGSKGYGWKEIRSIVSPTFTTGKMKLMHDIIHERVLTLVDILKQKSRINNCIDVYDELQALTLDVIGRTAFGVEADCLHNRQDEFYINCRNFFYYLAMDRSYGIPVAMIIPVLGKILRPFSAILRAQMIIAKKLKEVIIYRRKIYNEYNKIDLIQLLLQQYEERQKNESKPPIHIDTIVSNCYAFLLAGYETTSTALAYSCYLLAAHQDVQDRLYNEIIEKIGDNNATYDVVMKLPYLDAVFHEVLRLRPPVVSFTGRKCLKETVINGYKFIPGMHVNCPVNLVHWNEKNWENPEEFNPERFTGEKSYDPLTWIPFGIGPRNCVGLRFAEMEIKFTLVELIKKLKLELHEKSENPLKSRINIIIMRPLNGVNLKITPRGAPLY